MTETLNIYRGARIDGIADQLEKISRKIRRKKQPKKQ